MARTKLQQAAIDWGRARIRLDEVRMGPNFSGLPVPDREARIKAACDAELELLRQCVRHFARAGAKQAKGAL